MRCCHIGMKERAASQSTRPFILKKILVIHALTLFGVGGLSITPACPLLFFKSFPCILYLSGDAGRKKVSSKRIFFNAWVLIEKNSNQKPTNILVIFLPMFSIAVTIFIMVVKDVPLFVDCLVISTVFCFGCTSTMTTTYSCDYNHIEEDVIVIGGKRVIKWSLL